MNQPLKATNLHNYATFKNFDSLVLGQYDNDKTLMNLNKTVECYYPIIENNFNDEPCVKSFFIDDLNANLLLYKRLLENMKSQHEHQISKIDEIYSHLTKANIIQYLLSFETVKLTDWRESLLFNDDNNNNKKKKASGEVRGMSACVRICLNKIIIL